MSVPASHRERLDADLRVHEERLAHLQDQIARLASEAAIHEAIIRLGRDDGLLRGLADLYDECHHGDAPRDPAAVLTAHGAELPADCTTDVVTGPEGVEVSVRLQVEGWDCSCVWHSEHGFSTRQHTAG